MPDETKAIELRNVTKIYRKSHFFKTTAFRGVDNLSLSVEKGVIYCLLGLNGAGKTTTVKLILNLIFPLTGEILVMGRPVGAETKKKIGYVSESPYFFPYLTGFELLDLMGILSGMSKKVRRERIGELMGFLSISNFVNKKIKEYSKGMQQRLLLAQALLHDPEILIMDEPYSGLDPVGISEMREYILKLNSAGKTIFMTSHIIAEAEKIAVRCGILKKGKLVKEFPVVKGSLESEFLQAVKEG
ncbi:MAG: ABC transporter ATP-binding protein [Elusimicrobia bacterium]|nr:ABC transporter ATP-binding protein [Elusimicrobiota bacterium]